MSKSSDPNLDPENAAPNGGEIATTEQLNAEMLAAADRAFQGNIQDHELRMSRLSICQGTTKEIAAQVEGYSLGQIISSVSRQVLSVKAPPPWLAGKAANPTPVHFLPVIPVMKLPMEYLEWWKPEEKKEGQSPIKFKSLNPKDPTVLAGTYRRQGGTFDPGPSNNPPPIVSSLNYLFLPFNWETKEIIEGFIVGSFQKTSFPSGTMLTTMIQNRRAQKIFPWDSVYFLFTTPKPTKKGTTQIYNPAYGGLVKEICPDLRTMAQHMAVKCSHPDTGRQFQEAILNASEISEDESHDQSGGDAGDADILNAGSNEADEAFGDGTKQKF